MANECIQFMQEVTKRAEEIQNLLSTTMQGTSQNDVDQVKGQFAKLLSDSNELLQGFDAGRSDIDDVANRL
ncbi:hypothetical protein LX83_006057 [Goodfellowiella coeruleoviolacea]|uniref:Uncharacterized protein n=2 Tax=Goodfellowiella coeruleoviolacea TaxID=334858 RepID=A0AAE3GKB6_9PSEU|nr:hypothetical protein [Goodfellowiella coeruleoviolacea]